MSPRSPAGEITRSLAGEITRSLAGDSARRIPALLHRRQHPAEPVSLWLQGHPIDGGAAWELPLDIDEDGVARWSSGSVAPPVSNRIALRVAAAVTTAVTLSDLVLRYRTPLA